MAKSVSQVLMQLQPDVLKMEEKDFGARSSGRNMLQEHSTSLWQSRRCKMTMLPAPLQLSQGQLIKLSDFEEYLTERLLPFIAEAQEVQRSWIVLCTTLGQLGS
ncbi:hypothetical protein T11_11511 [Trichinella zimbabwensis]|uniref:Uncharacterized protein n=1 Tax=Trichinella zimbabwensis TaxID=268475 RepID=A0A0V1I6Y6_9BILA|nr:hypothetical protein T11_11511 [Trichinella zimbabwensis]